MAAQGPPHFGWIGEDKGTPRPDDLGKRIEHIEGMAHELIEELIVLRRDIATLKRKRKTGSE